MGTATLPAVHARLSHPQIPHICGTELVGGKVCREISSLSCDSLSWRNPQRQTLSNAQIASLALRRTNSLVPNGIFKDAIWPAICRYHHGLVNGWVHNRSFVQRLPHLCNQMCCYSMCKQDFRRKIGFLPGHWRELWSKLTPIVACGQWRKLSHF